MVTYEEAENALNNLPRFAEKHGLREVRILLKELGNPDRLYPSVHIAGTNGKGSVAAALDSCLRESGLVTGRFTSPHLVTMRERITLGGEMISEADFALCYEEAEAAAERCGRRGVTHPTFFEMLYLMACIYFARKKPGAAIIETGLGGRLDATNSLEEPLLCVITSISLDHVAYLGDTIGQIAAEKAGIIKSGAPVVFLGGTDASEVISKKAAEKGSEAIEVLPGDVSEVSVRRGAIDFSVRSFYHGGKMRLSFPTEAAYQAENAALAVRALEALEGRLRGFAFSENEIREGLLGTSWPCRMQEVEEGVFLDGAHNAGGIEAFARSLKEAARLRGTERIVLAFGAAADKEAEKMVRTLCRELKPAKCVCTGIKGKRRREAEDFAALFEAEGVADTACASGGAEAYEMAAAARNGGVAGICGSLYLAGEILEYLSKRGSFAE